MEVFQTLCIKTKATTNANTKSRTSKGSYKIQFRNLRQDYFTKLLKHSEMQHYLLVLKYYINYPSDNI